MQLKNWNDLRYLLALKRGRSIAAAARLIGVDDTTVSRRLAALQTTSEEPLFTRRSDGSTILTSKGETVASAVEVMEHQADLIGEALGSDPVACAGTVRLTSVPIAINRVLTPAVGTLLRRYPELQIELVPDSRDLNLTLREADLAIRLARPTAGGGKIKARRIGRLDYAIYASRDYPESEANGLPWITYEDAMGHISQSQWMDRVIPASGGSRSGLRVHDGETALEAVIAGLGRSLLPVIIADRTEGLRKLRNGTVRPLPSRELWLLAHADQMELRRIRSVIEWVENLFDAKQYSLIDSER